MEVNKDKLQTRVAECTVFYPSSISFGSWSNAYYLKSSFHIFKLCWSPFSIKLQWQTLDPQLYQKKPLLRRLSCKYIRIFSTFSASSNMSLLFGNIGTLFKRSHTIDVFLKMFFKTANFRNMLQKVYLVKLVYFKSCNLYNVDL